MTFTPQSLKHLSKVSLENGFKNDRIIVAPHQDPSYYSLLDINNSQMKSIPVNSDNAIVAQKALKGLPAEYHFDPARPSREGHSMEPEFNNMVSYWQTDSESGMDWRNTTISTVPDPQRSQSIEFNRIPFEPEHTQIEDIFQNTSFYPPTATHILDLHFLDDGPWASPTLFKNNIVNPHDVCSGGQPLPCLDTYPFKYSDSTPLALHSNSLNDILVPYNSAYPILDQAQPAYYTGADGHNIYYRF